ncbi:hypothetical protein SLS60_002955 [Paraconiothyrium brasiliense]|uniref:Uncharacterized protein n=1 Tax=Paraconiothyrium brasiliense TaxID=300254 RepID=A0ABR3RUA0_9PLEO
MANKTTSALAETAGVPPPGPEDPLLYGGGLLGFAFMTMTIVGLIFSGIAFYQKRKERHAAAASERQHQQQRMGQRSLPSYLAQARAMKRSTQDVVEGVKLQDLASVPRGKIRNEKGNETELLEYEEAIRDRERRRAYARLTGETDEYGQGMIGRAL